MRAWLLPESLNLDALLVDDAPKKSVAPKLVGMADGGRGRGRGRGRGGGGGRR
jgi:small nuclear ribonucleoprotein D1